MTHTSRSVCLAILLTWPVVAFSKDPDYTVQELDTLPGFLVGAPSGINERGQIVGSLGGSVSHAVMWDEGSVIELDNPTPPPFSDAHDINNRGQAVGVSGGRAVLWEDGTRIDLGVLMTALGINERGQIAGSIATAIAPFTHAALWQNGTIVDLGVLPGDSTSSALAINNRGQIVGFSSDHAFLWDKGKMSELPGLNGQGSAALDINDRGQVVGYSGPTPVMWENDTPIPLDTLPALTSGRALGINNNGQVVGFLQSPTSSSRVPVLWQKGKPVALPMLPPHPSFPNDYIAIDIANGGTIIGRHVRGGFPLPLVWVR